MRGLRVGFVCAGWSPDPGGVERVTCDLADELGRRGQFVAALALDMRGVLADGREFEQRLRGVRVRRVAWSHAAGADLVRTPALESHALRWACELELDLVHVQHLAGWGLGLPPRLAQLGLPVVWSLHDYWAVCARGQMLHVDGRVCARAEAEACEACEARTWPQSERGRAARAGDRLAAARAALAACSRAWVPTRAAREVLVRSGLEGARLELCENGIEPPPRVEPRPADGVLRVGVLGAVQPSKGVLELAHWIRELEGLELHVHGPRAPYHGDAAYVAALERLAQGEPRIELHGAYRGEQLPAILAGLDLVAVPSLWEEVHGLAAREARAAGLAVFAARVGGLAEGDFHLLPPGDRAAWREALTRFARDEPWRRSLRERAATPRSPAEMADQLEVAYVELVAAARATLSA